MELVAIQEFDEVEERISIVVILYMVWRDERMSWIPEKYNGTQQVTIPSNLVWTPDVILTSAVGTMKPIGSDQGWLTVRYDADGSALWTPGDGFVSSCALNVILFPFDKQVCSFAFITWGQLASEVVLNHMEDTLLTSFYQGNSQWEIAASHVESGATAGGFFSHFTVTIDLQRRSKFFVTNFVIPEDISANMGCRRYQKTGTHFRPTTMKFVFCLLVLLPLAFCVEDRFILDSFGLSATDIAHKICAVLASDGGETTCEAACSTVASAVPGASLLCPAACHLIQSGSHSCA
ncbi:acetylcholine receptor subunit beta-like [Mya arenaria]|uniref:acetylcholine receptor subunit beta-like n=1 Tax=Mya arenaria TaxID=6604 RepID=UPI0022E17F56|nr:acetylcholine receptor subunit beta-like [Mya arenaria]